MKILATQSTSPLLAALEYHYEDLVRSIARHFADRGFARDVVHEVCTEILERPPAQPVRTPLAFLRHLARHRAIDLSRADDARRRWCESMAEVPDTAVHHEDGAYALETAQHLQLLAQVIDSLPQRARQAYLLCRIHGMAQQEVADCMGISRNMVAQHLARAAELILLRWPLATESMGRQA